MGLIDEVLRGAIKQLTPPMPGAGWGTQWSRALPGERNYSSLVGDGMSNSIVAATVMWLVKQFPKAPVMLTKVGSDGSEQPVPRHPLLSLLARPNTAYSGNLLWWAVLVSFLADGNGYKLKARNDSDRLVEEWYVPHWMIEPKWPANGLDLPGKPGSGYISHYQYSPGVGTYKLDPKDVVHYRYGLDPDNTRKGRSPLKALLREVYTDDEAARFTAALLHNLGMPGVVISPDVDETVPQGEADAVKAKYQQEFGGDKRGMALVMRGRTSIQTIGFNPQELDLGRLREIPEERVTALIGVPAAVVGFGTGLQQTKVGATMAEMRRMGWEDGVQPIHTLIGDEIEQQELSEFEADLEPWIVGFDYSEISELQDSENEKATRWGELVRSGIAQRIEGREAFDLPTSESDRVYLQPIAIIENPAPSPKGATGEVKSRKASPRDARYLRELDRIAKRYAGLMSDDLEAAFDRLGIRAQTAAVAVLDGREARIASRGAEVKAEAEEFVARMMRALDVEQWQIANLGPIYTKYTEAVGEATFGAVSTRVGVGVEWDIQDPAALAVLKEGGRRLGLVDLTADTKSALFRSIEAAREAGEGPLALARRIRDQVPAGPYVNAGSKYRAELIARTETLHAQRFATLEAGQSAGFDEYVIFDARIGPTDDECEVLDQQIVSFEEAESLMADEHPNGTRSFSPVPRTQAARGNGQTKFGEGYGPGTRVIESNGEGGVRCSSCGAKIAEVAGPGTVIGCRKCKTVNRIDAVA
jgi:HK97 family phage portal protein